MKNLSKMLMAVAVFCFFSIACSKKTQQAVIANPASQERGQQDDQRPQRRGAPPQFSQLLTKMDSNNDGKLSITEVQGRIKDNFAKIDSDADGFISETEFQAAPKPKRKRPRVKN